MFRTRRQVEFRDTDVAGIVNFAVFFSYMEVAEHAFWKSIGLGVYQHDHEGILSWPRVSASCDYFSPARFEDLLDIDVEPIRVGEKSATFEFRFSRGEVPIATGKITCVCCRLETGQPPRSVPIPNATKTRLQSLCGRPANS